MPVVPLRVAPSLSPPAGDQRAAERFGVGLPYTRAGEEGQTRDLSATGHSFESDTAFQVGAVVKLTLRYGLDGHNFPLSCERKWFGSNPREGAFWSRHACASRFSIRGRAAPGAVLNCLARPTRSGRRPA
jgi:hypothetical protein